MIVYQQYMEPYQNLVLAVSAKNSNEVDNFAEKILFLESNQTLVIGNKSHINC